MPVRAYLSMNSPGWRRPWSTPPASTQSERGKAVVHETADLIYHALVMLTSCGVRLADVEAELGRRFGTSGLDEKAARDARQPRKQTE